MTKFHDFPIIKEKRILLSTLSCIDLCFIIPPQIAFRYVGTRQSENKQQKSTIYIYTIYNLPIFLWAVKLAIYNFTILILECLRFFSPFLYAFSAQITWSQMLWRKVYWRNTLRRYMSEQNRTNLIFYIREMSTYSARFILLVKKKKEK